MFNVYLDRLNTYTARLSVLQAMPISALKSRIIRQEITTCKREITYNINRLADLNRSK